MYFQGNNGTFDMMIENDEGVFEVTPHQGINEASFLIRVKDSSRIDFEKASGMRFEKFFMSSVKKKLAYNFVINLVLF